MKKVILLLILLFSFEAESSTNLIIKNITIIDAKNPIRLNQVILIEQGIIKRISNKEIYKNETVNKVIDGTGKYLIPGLWDAHVHLTFVPEINHKTYFDLFLKNGITSIRDTGAIIKKLNPIIDYIEKNPNKAPRLFYAGPLIDGKHNVYKGEIDGYPELSISLDESTNTENLVSSLIEEGVTFLKSYEMLTKSSYLKLLDTAKKNNLRVTGHIPLSIDLEEAIEAGLGGMQHLRNMEIACAKDAPELLKKRREILKNKNNLAGSILRSEIHSSQRYYAIDNYDAEKCLKIIKKISEYGVFQTPTLVINTFNSRRLYSDPKWRMTYEHFPKEVRDIWIKESENLENIKKTEKPKKFEQWSLDLVKTMNQNGVKIIAGTDTPLGYLTPGFSLHKELQLLSEAGMTPREVLRSATVTPAEFFDIEDKLGTIEEGKFADLVILKSNPLESVKNMQDIDFVIAKGKIQF